MAKDKDETLLKALSLLKMVTDIRKYQDRQMTSNQGQGMDGYTALANYNVIAEKIEEFLEEINT